MCPSELGKEAAIPLTHDEDTTRRANFPNERDPRLL